MQTKQTSIRKRIRKLFFILSITTLLLSGALANYGMFTTKTEMESMGKQLGVSTKESVIEIVSGREKNHLQQVVDERVKIIDSIFQRMAIDVETVSRMAGYIMSNPQLYPPQELKFSPNMEAGWAVSLAVAPSAEENLWNLRDRIGLAANIQEVLKSMVLCYGVDCSMYTAYEDGFDIVFDTNESDMRVHYFENPEPYRRFNFFERAWYKNAKETQSTTFTDAIINANSSAPLPFVACSAPIIVDGKFIGVTGFGFVAERVAKFVLQTKIGKTGFGFLLNRNGQVIISPKGDGVLSLQEGFPDLRQNSEKSLAEAAEKMVRGESGLMPVIVDGEEYYLAYAPLENVPWSFGAVIKVIEVIAPAENLGRSIEKRTDEFVNKAETLFKELFPVALLAVVLLTALVLSLSEKLSKSFVQPIQKLSEGVREIASGNLDKKLDIQTGDEIEHLAFSFNSMTDELKTYMANLKKETADKERIATELNVATNIQLSTLPHDFDFNRDDFEIYATMKAAKEVGGDFYDFYLVDEKHLVISIADVSGKSVPAALFMMKGKTILKNLATMMKSPDDLASVMTLANQQLCQDNDEMMFITVFLAMLDLETGRLIYVNGGHNPPLLYRDADKKFSWLDVNKSFVLGAMDSVDFVQQEVQLNHGDILFMYTDGVTEAINEAEEEYGEARLENCLNSIDHQCEIKILLEGVSKSLAAHVGKAEQSDDITMLAVRFV